MAEDSEDDIWNYKSSRKTTCSKTKLPSSIMEKTDCNQIFQLNRKTQKCNSKHSEGTLKNSLGNISLKPATQEPNKQLCALEIIDAESISDDHWNYGQSCDKNIKLHCLNKKIKQICTNQQFKKLNTSMKTSSSKKLTGNKKAFPKQKTNLKSSPSICPSSLSSTSSHCGESNIKCYNIQEYFNSHSPCVKRKSNEISSSPQDILSVNDETGNKKSKDVEMTANDNNLKSESAKQKQSLPVETCNTNLKDDVSISYFNDEIDMIQLGEPDHLGTLQNCLFSHDNLTTDQINCKASASDYIHKHGGFFPDSKSDILDDIEFKETNQPLKDLVNVGDLNHCDNEINISLITSVNQSIKNSTLSSMVQEPVAVVNPSLAKQTSLFSFFKPKSGINGNLSNSVTTTKTNSYLGKITARPDLPKSESFVPYSRNTNDLLPMNTSMANSKSEVKHNPKICPFYKKIPGTAITVDAFRYGVIPNCEAYILTHFHYDHYGGLTKKFTQPIFCSKVTGNLVQNRLGVDNKWINRLPLWQPCQVAGVTLTLMEANHCPGAVIILFELMDGRKILHTGDFRACVEMEQYQMLQNVSISELYLDTTYCNPSYAFPSQNEVIELVVSLVLHHVSQIPKTLIVCGAYTIGKERVFHAIAKILNSKICVASDKKKVLDCLDDADLKSRITLDWSKGNVHVLPMGKLNQKALFEHHSKHSQFDSILAFEPTGWTHQDNSNALQNLRPKWCKHNITLYGVPYSEHSSFLELKRFVQYLKPKKIVPTVNNGNPASRQKMDDIFKQWLHE